MGDQICAVVEELDGNVRLWQPHNQRIWDRTGVAIRIYCVKGDTTCSCGS